MTRTRTHRRDFIKVAGVALAPFTIYNRSLHAGETTRMTHTNLLFIMTDQQRWDAISCSGNTALDTPHIDSLAKEGVYFENAYTSCPVCSPARATLLTGTSIYTSGVLTNDSREDPEIKDLPTFDSVLAGAGYHAEYYGKWHTPYKYTACYHNAVKDVTRSINGRPSNIQAYRNFLTDRGVPVRPPKSGELIDNRSKRPYAPISMDWRYGMSDADFEAFGEKYRARQAKNPLLSQAGNYGRHLVPTDCSTTAFEGREALDALEAMDASKPFSLTCSFSPPHPPTVVPEPYFSQYKPEDMPVPASIDDTLDNSPYANKKKGLPALARYRDPEMVREMTAIYYGMVKQVDDWVGNLLAALERKGLKENTLVIFTSDHGEMLGDHGLHSKMMMYEGSAHIPLLMRLPGAIPAGARVADPVSHVDLFATILDYTGMTPHASEGRSLRTLIDGGHDDIDFAISEWGARVSGGPIMIRTREWKLILHINTGAGKKTAINALYNLEQDPDEMINLIGGNPNRGKHVATANRLKRRMRDWMARIDHPFLQSIEATEV